MTEDKAYKVHFQYIFNVFCKIVIHYAVIDRILKLRQPQRVIGVQTAGFTAFCRFSFVKLT